jgi:hypothetical protein
MTTADNWGQLMYDSADKTVGCVDDPPYNASYCGFNNFDGCIPLNGNYNNNNNYYFYYDGNNYYYYNS